MPCGAAFFGGYRDGKRKGRAAAWGVGYRQVPAVQAGQFPCHGKPQPCRAFADLRAEADGTVTVTGKSADGIIQALQYRYGAWTAYGAGFGRAGCDAPFPCFESTGFYWTKPKLESFSIFKSADSGISGRMRL